MSSAVSDPETNQNESRPLWFSATYFLSKVLNGSPKQILEVFAAVPISAGSIPVELGDLAELTVLRLDHNKIKGEGK